MSKICPNLRRAVLDAYGGKCYYCGADASHVDHIIPSALDGSDEPTNLIAACGPCNLRKGNKPLSPEKLSKALEAAARLPCWLGFLVTREQWKAIRAYAKANKLRLGEAIRELIDAALERNHDGIGRNDA